MLGWVMPIVAKNAPEIAARATHERRRWRRAPDIGHPFTDRRDVQRRLRPAREPSGRKKAYCDLFDSKAAVSLGQVGQTSDSAVVARLGVQDRTRSALSPLAMTASDAPMSEATAIQSVAQPTRARTRKTALMATEKAMFCLMMVSVF